MTIPIILSIIVWVITAVTLLVNNLPWDEKH
jgi:hypothetical protein